MYVVKAQYEFLACDCFFDHRAHEKSFLKALLMGHLLRMSQNLPSIFGNNCSNLVRYIDLSAGHSQFCQIRKSDTQFYTILSCKLC